VQLLQDAVVEIVDGVSQLIRIVAYVVVRDKPRDKLAVEKVVRGIDGACAPVSIVVGIGAGAERPKSPEGWDLPMVVVLLEAVHVLDVALKVTIFAHFLSLLFRHFPVVIVVVGGLPVQHRQILIANVVPAKVSVLIVQIGRLDGG